MNLSPTAGTSISNKSSLRKNTAAGLWQIDDSDDELARPLPAVKDEVVQAEQDL
jgi:hypothetical protein